MPSSPALIQKSKFWKDNTRFEPEPNSFSDRSLYTIEASSKFKLKSDYLSSLRTRMTSVLGKYSLPMGSITVLHDQQWPTIALAISIILEFQYLKVHSGWEGGGPKEGEYVLYAC